MFAALTPIFFKSFRYLHKPTCSTVTVLKSEFYKPIFLNPQHIMKLPDAAMVYHNNHEIHSTNNQIVKSASDLRSYRGLELTNGMKIMLISDPNTDKAAASMDVNIGYMCDPDDIPGLAHFCEHMLFLGTKKYPDEAEYHKFVSQHAGSCNAFTSAEHTNFFFDIGHEHLKDILDRFSQFFHSPLFDASCTDREVNAVHSEHEKNIMSDPWRLHQLDKSTSDPNHKYSKFSTGNKETLDTVPKSNNLCLRDELLRYHSTHYSSNVMALAVLGKEALDELEQMVVGLFSPIENKNKELLIFHSSPYREEDIRTCLKVVPIKDVRNLILTFPIPDLTEFYKSYPEHYVGHLIGHEGPGSLLSELKSLGWVNSLLAGNQGGARGFQFFVIHVDLTEDGMDHVNDIVTCMFQYIDMLRKTNVQEWIFNELKELDALHFRFKDKERPASCVTNVSKALHDYPVEDVLSAGFLLSDFKPDLIKSVVERLVPSNMRLSIVAKSFGNIATQTEKWYGTKYLIEPISSELIGSWTNVSPNSKFYLPLKNEFIPSDFVIHPLSNTHSKIPVLLKSDAFSKVWFKQDDQFKLPKACLLFELFSPMAYTSPQAANMIYMFTELFRDALNEYAYAAELAGLKYALKNSVYGIQVDIKGYHDKQSVLLDKVFTKMTTFKVDPKRFEIIKELYLRVLKNFETTQSYSQAVYFVHAIKAEKAWLKSDLLRVLPDLTCDDMQDFIQTFMSRLHIQALIHGNLLKADAMKLVETVERILKKNSFTAALVESELARQREICIPRGSSFVYHYQNVVRDISAVDLFLQVGLQNTKDNMLLRLLEHVINEPCFNTLRTKENLGYIVSSGVVRSNGVQGLSVVVQSEKSPKYLESRIEAFIDHVEEMLESMDDAGFKRHVNALYARILEKPKKLSTESLKHWMEILSQQLKFRRDEIEAAHLLTITKADLQNFYKEYIHINAPSRSKLVVHVLPKSHEAAESDRDVAAQQIEGLLKCPKLPQSQVIEDIFDFKKNMELYPRVTPYMDDTTPSSSL